MDLPQFTDPELYKLLEGVEDVLTPLAKEIPHKRGCDNCGNTMIATVDPEHPFEPGRFVQRFIYECPVCHQRVSEAGIALATRDQ